MRIEAKVIAKTVFADDLICTLQLCYPRFIHSQLMTHRCFARNARSSRAIPVKKMLEEVIEHPVYPLEWTKNKKGMSGVEEVEGSKQFQAKHAWDSARLNAVVAAETLGTLGVHKQVVNRLLEPFVWMYSVVTFTDLSCSQRGEDLTTFNPLREFLRLRDSKHAQPEIRELAVCIREAMRAREPRFSSVHCPYVTDQERKEFPYEFLKISAMRCARVSYCPPDTVTPNPWKDIERADELYSAGHLSPFEHPATAAEGEIWAQYYGWRPFRCQLDGRIQWSITGRG